MVRYFAAVKCMCSTEWPLLLCSYEYVPPCPALLSQHHFPVHHLLVRTCPADHTFMFHMPLLLPVLFQVVLAAHVYSTRDTIRCLVYEMY